jgi:hypothetical protein
VPNLDAETLQAWEERKTCKGMFVWVAAVRASCTRLPIIRCEAVLASTVTELSK